MIQVKNSAVQKYYFTSQAAKFEKKFVLFLII